MPTDVVLVRPTVAANVGAAARAARNAGLDGLSLVAPGDWRTLECWRTAWGAQDLLEQASVFPDLASALRGHHYVVAFTGRRDPGVPIVDVRDMAAELAARPKDESAALVFGPETSGLSQDELALCGRRAFIPSHPAQPSLNLSHAVMVAAYEVFRAGHRVPIGPRLARGDEKQALLALMRRALLALQALPEANTDGYFQEWTTLFQRADLTPKEVRLLEHMARKAIDLAAERAAAEPALDAASPQDPARTAEPEP